MLEAQNITCGYGASFTLQDVSLTLEPGRITAVVGPNGAGKSTLLRACGGQLELTSGSIELGGVDLCSLRQRDVAQRLSFVPQAEERGWPLTVEQSVALGRIPHRGWLSPLRAEDQTHIDAALAAAGLTELRERPITDLSGGEWRRVALARCLAQQAQVVLLDEPVAGLDLRYQSEMLSLIRRLTREKSLAIAIVLHDLNHAARFADEIVLLDAGSVVVTGVPRDALTAERLSTVYGLPVSVMPHPHDGSLWVGPSG